MATWWELKKIFSCKTYPGVINYDIHNFTTLRRRHKKKIGRSNSTANQEFWRISHNQVDYLWNLIQRIPFFCAIRVMLSQAERTEQGAM